MNSVRGRGQEARGGTRKPGEGPGGQEGRDQEASGGARRGGGVRRPGGRGEGVGVRKRLTYNGTKLVGHLFQ